MASASKSATSLENESIQNLVSDLVENLDSINVSTNESKIYEEEVKPAATMSVEKLETNITIPKSVTNISTRPSEPTHPLQFRWALWYLHADNSKKSWEDNLKKIAVFSTVEEFWALFNHLVEPSSLQRGCDYYLFKEGIKPMWEDTANNKGGRWLLFVDRKAKKLDEYWMELLLAIVGEQFEEYGNDICGIVVNVRGKADKLSVWTADANLDEVNLGIGKIFKEKLTIPDTETIQYESHKDASHRQNSNVKARLSLPQIEGNHMLSHSLAKDKEWDMKRAGNSSNSNRTEKFTGKREWRNRRLQRIDSK